MHIIIVERGLTCVCVCVCVQVPIEVRDATREKIQSLETERGQLEGALAGFRSMKE